MPRLLPRRKLSERGTTVTVWLPAGIAERMEREARRERVSRSKYVAALVRRAVDQRRPAATAA